MATILEALRSARYNLVDNIANKIPVPTVKMIAAIGTNQIDNAINLLKKGFPADYEIEDWMFDEWGETLENAPDFEEWQDELVDQERAEKSQE